MEKQNERTEKIMHVLDDDALEAVAGGASTKGLRQVGAWGIPCDHYVCAVCGMQGVNRSDHKAGCAVSGLARPLDAEGFNKVAMDLNGCWSCRHRVCGNNYPADQNDLYCGRQ